MILVQILGILPNELIWIKTETTQALQSLYEIYYGKSKQLIQYIILFAYLLLRIAATLVQLDTFVSSLLTHWNKIQARQT